MQMYEYLIMKYTYLQPCAYDTRSMAAVFAEAVLRIECYCVGGSAAVGCIGAQQKRISFMRCNEKRFTILLRLHACSYPKNIC